MPCKLTWQICPVVVRGEAETLELAYKKLKKAESLSDLDDASLSLTDGEQYGRGRRNGKRKAGYSSSSDFDSDSEEGSSSKILQMLPAAPPSLNVSGTSASSQNWSYELETATSASQSFLNDHDASGRNATTPSRRNETTPSGRNTEAPTHVAHMESREPNQSTNNENKIFKRLLSSVQLMRVELQSVKHTLGILVDRFANSNSLPSAATPSFNIKLPLESYEEVCNLEVTLQEEAPKNYLRTKFRNFGGTSSQDHVRRILRHLMTDEAAMLFTWHGSKNKKKFMNLKMAQLIVDSVQQEPTVTVAAIEDVIKSWLRHARERSEYRHKAATAVNE